MNTWITIHFVAGTSILDACTEAKRLAILLGIGVEFMFNDIRVIVHPDADPSRIVDNYRECFKHPTWSKIVSDAKYKRS